MSKKSFSILLMALFVSMFLPNVTSALGTPDGAPPPWEDVCEGESGAAYGLCTAYCRAMDCDSVTPSASEAACAKVAANFMKITDREVPCTVPCPMYRNPAYPYFNAQVSGTSPIQSCLQGWSQDDPESIVACSGTTNCTIYPPYGSDWTALWHEEAGTGKGVAINGYGNSGGEMTYLDNPPSDPASPSQQYNSCVALLVNAGAVNCAQGPYYSP